MLVVVVVAVCVIGLSQKKTPYLLWFRILYITLRMYIVGMKFLLPILVCIYQASPLVRQLVLFFGTPYWYYFSRNMLQFCSVPLVCSITYRRTESFSSELSEQ
jgi:hypothetical protein